MEAPQIVKMMMEKDGFSQWLGIEVQDVKPGYCLLSMRIRPEMLNGFGIAHGGISFSVADSALAFASNGGGRKSLSIETSISHLVSLKAGDELVAQADCESETEKLGHYKVKLFLKDNPDKPVALFRGIVYRTSKEWNKDH